MGGDNSPDKIIKALVTFVRSNNIFYKIYGNEKLLISLINKFNLSKNFMI